MTGIKATASGFARSSVLLFLVFGGCAAQPGAASKDQSSQSASPKPIDPQEVQARTMGYADRYLTAIAELYDQVQVSARTNDARIMAGRCRLYSGLGAMGNAVNPNPVAGMMDMAVMVTLTRELSGQQWAIDLFGADTAATMKATLEAQESDIWKLVGEYLTADQIRELHDVANNWLTANPGQRFVSGARLADVLATPPKPSEKPHPNAVTGLAGGIVSLLRLDPFRGLDPAVQQVEQSRVLAERVFFYLQHMPVLLSWQTDLLYSQMLANPQTQRLLADTSTVAGSTTRFTDSTARFADSTARFTDASSRLADSVEQFRRDLPQQQATLMDQLNQLVATQRDQALRQATTQISAIRDATVEQLGSTMTGQQKDLGANTQTVMDRSIDRLYARLRSLVIFAAVMLVLAMLLYRTIAAVVFSSRGRR